MNARKFVLTSLLLTLFVACGRDTKSHLDINVTGLSPEKVQLKHYGWALFGADTGNLQAELIRLQPEFPHFLDADLSDSANIMQIFEFVTDTQLIALYHNSRKVFGDFGRIENELTVAFRRFHYHFPGLPVPDVFTYISGVQYEMPVLVADNKAVVAIDCYLGADNIHYRRFGIPLYLTERMTPDHLINDVFRALFEVGVIETRTSRTILDEMILAGKRLYFQEAMQPRLPDHILIGYSAAQLDWVKNYETQLWAHLIGEELLYSTDFMIFRRLFGDGPFSHDFSRESPARMGEWVGWQIVRNYMRNNAETSLEDLMQVTDSQAILIGSRYRPK